MKNFKQLCIYSGILFLAIPLYGDNTLRRVVFTYGSQTKNTVHFERASLVLCFAKEPRVTYRTTMLDDEDDSHEHIFTITGVTLNTDELNRLIRSVRSHTNPDYTITIAYKEKSLSIRIIAQEGVRIYHEVYDSIQHDKCVAIKIVDSKMLDIPQKPTIQFAHNNPPPKVVIDCGHGGNDAGAIGVNGIAEKTVCLSVGLFAAQQLQAAGIPVILTRATDIDVGLDERIMEERIHNADIFISLHANAAPHSSAQGIETFYYTPQLVHTHTQHLPEHHTTTIKQVASHRTAASKDLAHNVHTRILDTIHATGSAYTNRGVKTAVAHVLYSTHSPAVLIEMGFVTNPHEAQRLTDPAHQALIATGICKGIISFLAQQSIENTKI